MLRRFVNCREIPLSLIDRVESGSRRLSWRESGARDMLTGVVVGKILLIHVLASFESLFRYGKHVALSGNPEIERRQQENARLWPDGYL
jgi:hypothetical protein